jgi:hypothetical protein
MPADGIGLPQTKGNFGTSRWAARRLGYIKGDIGRKGHVPYGTKRTSQDQSGIES